MLRQFAVLFFLLPTAAFAYVRTISDSGRPLFWTSPSVTMYVNPTNSSGLSDGQVGTMLGQAFSAWSGVGSARLSANISTSSGYGASTAADGRNSIYFASRAGRQMDWGVIAITEVFYYLADGRIAEADMALNDNQFLFTANEGDTGKSIGGRTAIYLRDVTTHEAGHVFGFDHSTVNLSSMIYTAFNGQYSLSGDDQAAAQTAYPNGGTRGAIHGTVRGLNGGIFGTHVTAINLATGKVAAGALAEADGGVRIGDLPPGKYSVMFEPLGTDPSTISLYYQNVNHRFCSGGSNFRRRFYAGCNSATAGVIDVRDGVTSEIGALAPMCNPIGNPQGAPNSLGTAREIGVNGGAVFGTLNPGETHYFKLSGLNGDLSARAIAYALYSPADVKVRILDSSGAAVAGATSLDNVETLPGGNTNYDSLAEATGLNGDYILAVSAAASYLGASKYSAGYDLLDRSGHYLLSFGVNGNYAVNTPDMSACVGLNNRPQSASMRAPASSSGNGDKKASGCGSLGGDPDHPFSGGMAQLLLAVGLIQLILWVRRSARPALVRIRR